MKVLIVDIFRIKNREKAPAVRFVCSSRIKFDKSAPAVRFDFSSGF